MKDRSRISIGAPCDKQIKRKEDEQVRNEGTERKRENLSEESLKTLHEFQTNVTPSLENSKSKPKFNLFDSYEVGLLAAARY